jgi:hypothetical protein
VEAEPGFRPLEARFLSDTWNLTMWREITEDDLLNQISGAEIEALRSAVLGMGQSDPVQPAIDQVVAEVRGYITANQANSLDADPAKIPDRLIGAAVSLIIIQIMTRAGGMMIDPESARSKRADESRRLLRDVAAGKFSITDPDSGAENSATVAPRYTPRRSSRRFDRNSQDAL